MISPPPLGSFAGCHTRTLQIAMEIDLSRQQLPRATLERLKSRQEPPKTTKQRPKSRQEPPQTIKIVPSPPPGALFHKMLFCPPTPPMTAQERPKRFQERPKIALRAVQDPTRPTKKPQDRPRATQET